MSAEGDEQRGSVLQRVGIPTPLSGTVTLFWLQAPGQPRRLRDYSLSKELTGRSRSV